MMMTNILSGLPRMVILTIIFAIFNIHPFIHAADEHLRAPAGVRENQRDSKMLINLDVSEDHPLGIIAIQSSIPPRYKTYTVDGQYGGTHRIGAVLDGGIMVLRGNERNVERNVQYSVEGDGRKVVRITDVWEGPGGPRTKVIEMMRLPGETLYEELRRIPVDIDLLKRCPHQISIHRYPDSGVITYAIRRRFRDRFIIGMVKYGGHNVEDGPNENVIKREVTLYMHKASPRILVTSQMKDGNTINERYLFVKGEDGGMIIPTMREITRPL